MENIKLALLSLKKGISEGKAKANSDVNAAIIKLSAVLTFFKQDTLSDDDFLKLSDLLRRTTQPLYKQNLDLTLNFASATFLALQTAKVSTAKDASSKKAWEMAQSSILAGLLDYLDDNRTAKTKGPMGEAFFSSLCKLYVPTFPDGRISTHTDLLTIVYMLLSELVAGQAANGLKFRKELSGGRRLGYAIFNMKDFLPLEAALDLFANLLFTLKGTNGKADRIKFIQDVFHLQLSQAPRLLPMLENVTTSPQWADVFPDVMKTLSSLNMSFPQLFDVSNFQITGLQAANVDKLYLESASIVLSIPTDEGDDTLFVPMQHVSQLEVSSSGGDISVSLTLNKPPIIGKKLMDVKEKVVACQWILQKKDTSRFLNNLKHRNIPFDALKLDTRRKLSLADAVSLDLSSDAGPPKPTQEKAIAIAKLWDGPEPSQGGADFGTTSPLMHSIFPPKSDELNELPLLDEPSVFIDGKGNFTNKPTQPVSRRLYLDSSPLQAEKVPEASKEVLLKKSLSLLMSAKQRTQEDADDTQPKTARRRGSGNIVVSDGESEPDADDGSYAPSPTPTRRPSPRLSRAPTLTKIPEGKVVPAPAGGDKKAVASAPPAKEVKPRPTLRTRSARNKENATPANLEEPEKPLKSLKRRASPELVIGDDDEPPLPPAKKSRPSPDKEVEKPKPRPTRYKSKMKESTPAVINLDEEDEDEPPKAVSRVSAKPIAKKQAAETHRTGKRANQMKDKSGKAKPRSATAPINKRTTRATANARKREVDMEDVKSALTVAEVEPEEQPKIATIVKSEPKHGELSDTTPLTKVREARETKPSSRKPKKAVWQRDSFMANLEAQKQSTPARQAVQEGESDSITFEDERAPEGAFQFDSEPPLPEAVKAESSGDPMDLIDEEENDGSDTFVNEQFVEYSVPIKGEPNTSQEEPDIVKEEPEDVVMIDLTSPKQVLPASVTPVPARAPMLAKPRRDAAPPARVEPVLESKKIVPAPVSAPRHQQQLSVQPEVTERLGVKRGRAVERKPVASTPADSKAVQEPQQAKESVSVMREVVEERVQVIQQPEEDEESEVLNQAIPKPVEKIVQKYIAPVSADIQPQKSVNEKRLSDYRLKLPVVRVQDRSDERVSVFPKQRFVGEVPKTRPGLAQSSRKEARMKEPVKDIVEVLREIQEALAEKVNNRFEETRQEMTQAQLALLHQAADDLKPMAHEAAEHFNNLVDLEAEYGAHRRKIMTGIDTFRKSTSQATGALKQVIQSHNRHSLVKKFPAKLLLKPLPPFALDLDF